MKLYYSPSYSSHVHTGIKDGEIQFNQKTVNTSGLVCEIEMHAGLHIEVKSFADRLLAYYSAFKVFADENPESSFSKSFRIDGLNTAKQCLYWRDVLILGGWNPGNNGTSERLAVLSKVEENFSLMSSGEKLLRITQEVKDGCLLPCDLEIITPFDWHCFMPAEKALLEAIASRIGAERVHAETELPSDSNSIRIYSHVLMNSISERLSLTTTDGSIEIWEFEEKNDALQYLSQLDAADYDLWINRDNRAFDSWLGSVNKPFCGSYDKGVSQISALPLIGLGIFSRPLNVESLLSWLTVPVSPLSAKFRRTLVDAIVNNGGYFNDTCRKILDSAEDDDRKLIPCFLPDMNSPEEATSFHKIPKTAIEKYVQTLSGWIGVKLHSSAVDSKLDENQIRHLASALQTCQQMLLILDVMTEDMLAFEDLILIFESLSSDVKAQVNEPQASSQNMINSSSNIAAISDRTIWCDFYNPDEDILTYSFLLSSEKALLKDTVWSDEDERIFNRCNKYLPFMYTRQKLVLVTVNKDGTADALKEPFIIRMKKSMGEKNYQKAVEHPNVIDLKGVTATFVDLIENRGQSEEGTVSFKRTDLVQFRETESYSSISTLIEHPFDYVFDKLLKLRPQGAAALSPIYTTKGTVAHAIIEELFNPENGGTPESITRQIDERFYKVFDQKVLESGAILLQAENLDQLDIFRSSMKDCVKKLVKVIGDNDLRVTACEQNHDKVEFPEFQNAGISFTGSIDMVLEDKDGVPVIFDFKYSGGAEKYQKLIEENRSMQLSLYKGLVYKATEKNAKAAAYVLLPDVSVITADNLVDVFVKCNVDDALKGNLLIKMNNSYLYRKNQILSGTVEDGEGIPASSLAYEKDTEDMMLYPLDVKKKQDGSKTPKAENRYSNYKFFKAGE